MSGTIAIVAQDTARFSEFTVSLANLRRPRGWNVVAAYGCEIADSRQRLAEHFLRHTLGEHLFFLDDDHWFEPDLLERLLAHGKDVVGPLCLKKRPPFRPANAIGYHDDPLAHPPGLHEVELLGASGLLVNRRVLAELEPPWFWPPAEDVGFCARVRAEGFTLFQDSSTLLGHLTAAVVLPHYDGERWEAWVELGGGVGVSLSLRDDLGVEGMSGE